jgi:hypothetical protein
MNIYDASATQSRIKLEWYVCRQLTNSQKCLKLQFINAYSLLEWLKNYEGLDVVGDSILETQMLRQSVRSQSVSGVSAFNTLVVFYDIHGKKGEVLFFSSVQDGIIVCVHEYKLYGCNANTKMFLNYIGIMHVTYINLPLESRYLLKNRMKIRWVVIKV